MSEEIVKNNERVAADVLAQYCAKVADEKMGEDVLIIPLAGKTSVADYMVIATANSMPHLTALASHIERGVREDHKLRVYTSDGRSDTGWIVLDYVTVVVHLMLSEVRVRYGLESLWSGAPTPEAMGELESQVRRG
jgi:ribosome-associated protein